jgi:hypothetical protein
VTAADPTNGAGLVKLDAMIDRIKRLPETMVKAAADDIAVFVRKQLAATIAAGESPDEDVWRRRKSDGSKALQNAMQAVQVGVADGPVVFAYLTGPEARHHRGWVRGGIKRQILPTELPAAWVPKIREILQQHFAAAAFNG